jgi:stage V sporulation protein D (sporulation-specific penicillin-binding protein)
MAAPVVGEIMSDVLPYLGVQPEYTAAELSGVDTTVPSTIGMSLDEAKQALTKSGLNYKTVGNGDKVTDQTPAGGSVVPSSAAIVLYMGGEKPDKSVSVPDVRGMSAEQANKAITDAGLYMKATGATSSSSSLIRADKQSIGAGESVAPGTVVEVQFTDISIYD